MQMQMVYQEYRKSKIVTTMFLDLIKPVCQTVIVELDNTSLLEGIVTQYVKTDMNIEEGIPKEILSSTALIADIRFMSEALEKGEKPII